MERIPLWLIGIALLASGLSISHYLSNWLLPARTGEALVVAGVLSLVVDPLLKARLVREASAGIFPHMLGFDQPPEVKDRLKELALDTVLYRKDFKIRCSFTRTQDGTKLYIEYEYELINPSASAKKFKQALRLEPAQKPKVHEFSLTKGGNWVYRKPEKEGLQGPMWVAEGKEIEIDPSSAGTRYFFSAKYTINLPSEFYWHLAFGYPTINVHVDRIVPDDLVVTHADYPLRNEDLPIYRRLFMPGERIDFRWNVRALPPATHSSSSQTPPSPRSM